MTEPSGPIIQGTLDLLVLLVLTGSAQHGAGISDDICRSSDGVIRVEEGALYTALHRLEDRGLLTSYWAPSQTNRRAKYYALSSRGRRELLRKFRFWRTYVDAVDKIGMKYSTTLRS